MSAARMPGDALAGAAGTGPAAACTVATVHTHMASRARRLHRQPGHGRITRPGDLLLAPVWDEVDAWAAARRHSLRTVLTVRQRSLADFLH